MRFVGLKTENMLKTKASVPKKRTKTVQKAESGEKNNEK